MGVPAGLAGMGHGNDRLGTDHLCTGPPARWGSFDPVGPTRGMTVLVATMTDNGN